MKSLLVLILGLYLGIGSAVACDGGKCAKPAKATKASASCMKDGKCTMKGAKASAKCDMKAMKAGGACDMKAGGTCDMKATKASTTTDKAAATPHSCCAAKTKADVKS